MATVTWSTEFSMANVECSGGRIRLLFGTNGGGLELPVLPGTGDVEGIRASELGVEAKRGGRLYFLSFKAKSWVEAS